MDFTRKKTNAFYYICPFCDASLDHGETCDCRKTRMLYEAIEKRSDQNIERNQNSRNQD